MCYKFDMAQLIQALPEGPVDIVGDIHGEADALHRLLERLGCDVANARVQRPLVFVGDLIDRGPDSPAVVETVMRLVEAGVAQCVLGNHELNVLFGSKKEGNGWLRGDESDHYQYKENGVSVEARFDSRQATVEQANRFKDFFATLPLAAQCSDLRVVHACWHLPSIADLPDEGSVAELAVDWARAIHQDHKERGLWAGEKAEREEFADLKRLDVEPSRHLPNHAVATEERQSKHPIKVLTSGLETPVDFEDIFFVGGRWRFVRRFDWWTHYEDTPAVVVGHYWRRRENAWVEDKPDPWHTETFADWTGPKRNVFCVDYSVGRRFVERAKGKANDFEGSLAALRWPERTLVFSDRDGEIPTRW